MKIISFHQIFNENAQMLAEQLNVEYLTTIEPVDGELYLIYGAHDKAHLLIEMQKKYKCKIIIMNSESHKSIFFKNKYYLQLMKDNAIFDYNEVTAKILKEKYGVKVLGLHWFDFPIVKSPNKWDIDILFIGTPSQKRLDIYKQLVTTFPKKNIIFLHNCFDQNKINDYLTRSKYVLNIPFYEHNILETHRINKALSCGCNVVSLDNDEINEEEFFYDHFINFTDNFINYFHNPDDEKMSTIKHLKQMKNNKLIPHIKFMTKYYNML